VETVVVVAVRLITESGRPAPDSVGFDVSAEWNHSENSFSRRGGCTGFGAFAPESGLFDDETGPFAVPPVGGGYPLPSLQRTRLFPALWPTRFAISVFFRGTWPQELEGKELTRIRDQGTEISGPWTVDQRRERGGVRRRAWTWLKADGNSMRREGKIIGKRAGKSFGRELDRVGCGICVCRDRSCSTVGFFLPIEVRSLPGPQRRGTGGTRRG
jgi:hypothetical protein